MTVWFEIWTLLCWKSDLQL